MTKLSGGKNITEEELKSPFHSEPQKSLKRTQIFQKGIVERWENLKRERKERVDAKNEAVTVLTDVRSNLEARHRDHHLGIGKRS